MKDIQYFLSEEEKYLASSQAEPELVWNEELEEFGFSYDPLSFLGKKPFQSFQHNNIDKENRYGLTDVEKMIDMGRRKVSSTRGGIKNGGKIKKRGKCK